MAVRNEEELAAFVDGAVEDPSDAERIAQLIEQDAEAAAYADKIRRSNAQMRAAFEDVLDAPVPEAMATVLSAAGADMRGGRAADRVLGARTAARAGMGRHRPMVRRGWVAPALAAGIALAVGLGAGLQLSDRRTQETAFVLGAQRLDDPLARTLEELPSGSASAEGIQPMLSFLDGQGRPCREFERLAPDDGPLEVGIACRTGDGIWEVAILVTSPMPDGEPVQGIVPASGPGLNALDAMLQALDAGPTLDAASEAQLLANRWRD